jgi:seryl-tRNA synthetase
MLDLAYIRDHAEEVARGLERRGIDESLEPLLELDAGRRSRLTEIESLQRERNAGSKEIGRLIKEGGDVEAKKAEIKRIGQRVDALRGELESVEQELQQRLHELPNLPHESVPDGASEADNPVVRKWGEPPQLASPKAHWEIGVELGVLDFERAAKISGARFVFGVGDGALLERALIQLMLDLHTREHGYTELVPPFMVQAQTMFGTGQLPKFEQDLFRAEPGGFYLIPTAEVPVTNLHADEILDGDALPLAYCAYTPCFRSEAGSYGKDVRGLIRLHQFNKVELVRFSRPEDSYEQLELLTSHAEEVLKRLELHYRTVALCAGDLGYLAAKTYDLEVWLPAQKTYREISSCSNYETYQARRAKIRYRRAKGEKPAPLHTLNGSGLAVGRTLVAILENYQQPDGSVAVPEALRPYMHGKTRIEPTAFAAGGG